MKTSTRSGPVRHGAAVLVLALVVAGCAGDGGDAGADAATVDIGDNSYRPGDLEVPVGASVSWTNHDSVPHTVTFTDEAVASSDTLDEGESFSTGFDAAGTYAYVCALHPEMQATVTVSG